MTEYGLKLFRQEISFFAGVAKISQFPKLTLPQIAFVGKSNVGKSSLINKICKRKSLARVSHTPGRTQQINFFSVVNKFLIADLPGYGFAKVPKQQKINWEKLILYYLENSEKLKQVYLLIDARRGIKANDVEIISLLTSLNIDFQIVFTKGDKININDEFFANVRKQLAALNCSCNVTVASSKNNQGIKELQLSILDRIASSTL